MRNWEKHEDVIQKILLMINTKYPCMFVLKGGTALRQCYGLDRRSENIDLDGRNLELDIGQVIKEYCKKNGHTFNLRKDTRQTRRFILHYADAPSADDLLKIEISYRKSEFPDYMYKNNGRNLCL